MGREKYRQRIQGGKWKTYSEPSRFRKDAEFRTDIIKSYDEYGPIGVYHIGYCRNSADDRYFNHLTKRFKLVFVLEGGGWFNGLPVRGGQGFLMWQNHVNSMSADITSPWEYYYVSFSGGIVEDLLLRSGFTPEDTIFDIPDVGQVSRLCGDMIYRKRSHSVPELDMLGVLFELLSVSAPRVREAEAGYISSDMNEHVSRAIAYMSKNYRSRIGVGEVAEATHLSEKYLRELFKKEMGRSVQSYLTDLRLSAAKNMLSNSKYNIGEIALLSGFGEYRNFVRVFKERCGMTPTEYRETRRG